MAHPREKNDNNMEERCFDDEDVRGVVDLLEKQLGEHRRGGIGGGASHESEDRYLRGSGASSTVSTSSTSRDVSVSSFASAVNILDGDGSISATSARSVAASYSIPPGNSWLPIYQRLQRELEDELTLASKIEYSTSMLHGDEASAKNGEKKSLMRQIDAEVAEEKRIQREILELEKRENLLEREEAELDAIEFALETALQRHLEEENVDAHRCEAYEDAIASANVEMEAYEKQLANLTGMNIYNDMFFIWHDGPFGTICGLRLGRLYDVTVDWTEINAAWGQAALLLHTIAKDVDFTFQSYEIVPYGSYSCLRKVRDKADTSNSATATYKLHCNGGFFKTSFNNAMVAYLSCTSELAEYAEYNDRTMRVPYKIEGDKIAGYSIRTGFGGGRESKAKWTKALKYLLTDLKWLLAWCVKRHNMMGK